MIIVSYHEIRLFVAWSRNKMPLSLVLFLDRRNVIELIAVTNAKTSRYGQLYIYHSFTNRRFENWQDGKPECRVARTKMASRDVSAIFSLCRHSNRRERAENVVHSYEPFIMHAI